MNIQATVGERAVRVCERILFGLLGLNLAVLMLFIAGNHQGFAPTTQNGLLAWMRILSAAVAAGGATLAVLAVLVAVAARRFRMLLHATALVLVTAIGLLVLVAATTVAVLQLPL